MVKKTGDWKKHVETNSRLMKKFEESRSELEKVLRVAQQGLEEKGNPEDLLRRHTVSSSLELCHRQTEVLGCLGSPTGLLEYSTRFESCKYFFFLKIKMY